MSDALIRVENLCKDFYAKKGLKSQALRVLSDVSFDIKKGEVFGLVGESGCGKTTVGRTLMRLYEPTSGEIYYNDEAVTKKNHRKFYGKMQMVFQDPFSSLDPRKTIYNILQEPLKIQKLGTREEQRQCIITQVRKVGLNEDQLQRYPHEFSGGQRQRIAIARAMVTEPEFIICDESVSALDVSIQAQVLNMLMDLQKDMGLTYLFISHDLAVVRHICDRIAVMYLGNILELADADTLFKQPAHPYTQALLSAIPVPDPMKNRQSRRIILEGELPGLTNIPKGCVFSTRCPYATEACRNQRPKLESIAPGHWSACPQMKTKIGDK